MRGVNLVCAAVAALLMAAAIAPAETPGRHPHYLRARGDLRLAQSYMRVREEPNVARNLREAVREVEEAIRECDRAAILDRKDLVDHPPVDVGVSRRERFRKILKLLTDARGDIGREEDNARARGWRDAAFRHIDAALEHVRRAAREARIDRLG